MIDQKTGCVKFAVLTREDNETVRRIVERAVTLFDKFGVKLDRLSLRMDLCAVHASRPLDFEALLAATGPDFTHDIGGIMKHMDRATGSLGDCFVPRCSRRRDESAETEAR